MVKQLPLRSLGCELVSACFDDTLWRCTHMTGAFKAKVPADEGARDGGIDLVDQAGHGAEISAMPWGGDGDFGG